VRPTRRNTDDRHLRELERRVLAGDLTAVSALARAYERVARGEPPFDVTEQTRRLVADVERVEETGEHGSIRDVLTELVHLARERSANIEELLAAAIEVADEERRAPGPYVIGSLVIPGTTCNERWSTGHRGSIVIGGDSGDVHAREAVNTGDGVEMSGVELRTYLRITDREAIEIAESIVRQSWESVGEDTFRITRSRQ